MISPQQLFERLTAAGLEFVIIGELAACVYGCRGASILNEICFRFETAEFGKLRRALSGLQVSHRKTAGPLEVDWDKIDSSTDALFLNVDGVALDCYSRVPAIGSFNDVAKSSRLTPIGGCSVLSASALITSLEASEKPHLAAMARQLRSIEGID